MIAKPRGSWEQDEVMRMRIGWFLIAILTWTVIGLRLFGSEIKKEKGKSWKGLTWFLNCFRDV